MKGLMKEVMLEMSRPPEVEKLPGITVPTEDIELVVEKINYRVA
jgi:hypothetical protein